jgi:hypothetical protein
MAPLVRLLEVGDFETNASIQAPEVLVIQEILHVGRVRSDPNHPRRAAAPRRGRAHLLPGPRRPRRQQATDDTGRKPSATSRSLARSTRQGRPEKYLGEKAWFREEAEWLLES